LPFGGGSEIHSTRKAAKKKPRLVHIVTIFRLHFGDLGCDDIELRPDGFFIDFSSFPVKYFVGNAISFLET
jgi:hypothetical protein